MTDGTRYGCSHVVAVLRPSDRSRSGLQLLSLYCDYTSVYFTCTAAVDGTLPSGVSVGLQPAGSYSCRQESVSQSSLCLAGLPDGLRSGRPSRPLYSEANQTGGDDDALGAYP